MATVTIAFKGTVVLPTAKEQKAFDEMIGWSAKARLQDGTEINNPTSREARFHTWLDSEITGGLQRQQNVIAQREASFAATVTVEEDT